MKPSTPDNNGSRYVTWRDLGDKLDEVYETIDGKDGIRERLTRVETWMKILVVLLPLSITFGPELAKALT